MRREPSLYSEAVTFRVVVLVSGSGTLLQALLDARAGNRAYEIVAVGADRRDITGLERARRVDVPTFTVPLERGGDRADWDRGLTEAVAAHEPDLVVCAGFMKLLGPAFLGRFGGRTINSHPALLPSFPGTHGPRDALAHGVKITGATVFMVDAGIDTGTILAQRAVDVLDDDTVETLHERIKVVERQMLVEAVDRLAMAVPTTD
ncbi:Phosphoribosylglycinamide formyltransferase [Acidipropionibacterium virtanenii]|uniref:Phosphoribosylglycinamide formyltransferase n=1 Tax=Acidipropionibacterium virtanenii TaxID=2057246 RepID=A0A344USH9_9ACTN|nr:Phosphoribosylglycinamide formyltransferase [Acidipropionibacterium virtanenii]